MAPNRHFRDPFRQRLGKVARSVVTIEKPTPASPSGRPSAGGLRCRGIRPKRGNEFDPKLRAGHGIAVPPQIKHTITSRQTRPPFLPSAARHERGRGASVLAEGFPKLPDATGFAAIGDPDITRHFAETVAAEYRAVGITMALSPQGSTDGATQHRAGKGVPESRFRGGRRGIRHHLR